MDGTPVMRNTWFCYKEKQSSSKALKDFIRYIHDNVVIDVEEEQYKVRKS
jgi:hypothetical protein